MQLYDHTENAFEITWCDNKLIKIIRQTLSAIITWYIHQSMKYTSCDDSFAWTITMLSMICQELYVIILRNMEQ